MLKKPNNYTKLKFHKMILKKQNNNASNTLKNKKIKHTGLVKVHYFLATAYYVTC